MAADTTRQGDRAVERHDAAERRDEDRHQDHERPLIDVSGALGVSAEDELGSQDLPDNSGAGRSDGRDDERDLSRTDVGGRDQNWGRAATISQVG